MIVTLMLIVELVQFERQKVKDACRDAENVKAKEVGFLLSCKLSCLRNLFFPL